MTVSRCSVCRGKKTVLGLGGLVKTCIGCKGVGYVSAIKNESIGKSAVVQIPVEDKDGAPIVVKRTRKAKVVPVVAAIEDVGDSVSDGEVFDGKEAV
jgi:hypothetical protein